MNLNRHLRRVNAYGPKGFDLEVYRGFKLTAIHGDYSTQPLRSLDALAGMPIRSLSLVY